MTPPVLVSIPRARRPVGVVERDGVIDLHIAPLPSASSADKLRAEVIALAKDYGDVDHEGRCLRLTVSPVFDVAEVADYFRALYPAYEGESEARR